MKQSIRLSQNFLHNQRLIEKLVRESSVGPDDLVLDIGAGSGSITEVLASRARQVIAYETDERLAANLVARYVVRPQVQIVIGDFLTEPLPAEPYKVFANIPFNMTSDIVRKLLDGFNPPSEAYLIMQREAALKFMGQPGHQTLTAALRGPLYEMHITYEFKATDFVPQPKVKIVLLYIKTQRRSLIPATESELYEDFVSYIYNHANPNVLPSLQKLFPGKRFANIEQAITGKLTAKPSQLELSDWITAFHAFQTSATNTERAVINGAARKLQTESQTIEKHHRSRSAKNWRQV